MNYEHEDARRGYEQAVDANPNDYAWSEWLVYPDYVAGEHGGQRFVYAPMTDPVKQLRGRRRYRPLSRPTAALFLEFARWPETEGMDLEPLESKNNEMAAREWAEINGVLGLSSSQPFEVFGTASHAIGSSLGIGGAVRPRLRNEGHGGREETVAGFAREAWVANMTLRLYEAATNPEGPDLDAIAAYMSDQEDMGMTSAKTLHGQSAEHVRSWALQVVEEIVEDRMRGRVWPIPVRDYNERFYSYAGHKQGWAFDSLLGAMWLQMMWLMLGRVRRCEWCGRLLDTDFGSDPAGGYDGRRKTRSDKRFCENKGKCKGKWNYHRGGGKSSKEARKKRREGTGR